MAMIKEDCRLMTVGDTGLDDTSRVCARQDRLPDLSLPKTSSAYRHPLLEKLIEATLKQRSNGSNRVLDRKAGSKEESGVGPRGDCFGLQDDRTRSSKFYPGTFCNGDFATTACLFPRIGRDRPAIIVISRDCR
jgi:hypothetical protein